MKTFLFASESVTEGHPDKLCDQISDAILDACLEQDAESKVDCEACVKSDVITVIGEITTKARVNYEKIARDTCRSAGYASPPPSRFGLDPDSCRVLVNIEPQNPDVAEAVHGNLTKPPEEIGAGDQGHMFGYATDETPEYMPLSHSLASRLAHRLAEVRKDGTCPWLGPYGKTEVVVEHRSENGAVVPIGVRTVLITAQHDETNDTRIIERELKERVVLHAVPDRYLDGDATAVRFDLFGPGGRAFTGLTGRRIVADAYGGWGAHGGGAFSGKDATKVHRTGAYAARRAAKSVVASGLARRCLVQVAYGIGMAEPLSVFVDTYGTGKVGDREVLKMVRDNFDFRPGIVAAELDLKRGGNFRYQKTASYGHFGRDDPDFTWENIKLLGDLLT